MKQVWDVYGNIEGTACNEAKQKCKKKSTGSGTAVALIEAQKRTQIKSDKIQLNLITQAVFSF